MTTLGYLARATGIVAVVLAVAALVWGLLFSARETGERLRPAWWLDLHNWLGGLTLAFVVLHLVVVFFDSDWGIGLRDILVPGIARDTTWAVAWGVLAFEVFAVVVLTSWPKRRFRKPVWRAVHLLSIPATVFAAVHGYQLGTDGHSRGFESLLAVLAGVAMYPVALRLLRLRTGERGRARPRSA